VHKTEYYRLLKRRTLPRPATWVEEGERGPHSVLIDTVQRFKGLEAPIVILWGLDAINPQRSEELLYVAMSRAKSLLVVVGTPATCAVIRG
jgi:superfamily I DNA and RNA helicase